MDSGAFASRFWRPRKRCSSAAKGEAIDSHSLLNLGKAAIGIEHFCETTSISPPFVMISAAAGSQTNVEGLKGS